MILTVPNMLTFSRMLLTPYLGYLVVAESYTMACVVFTVAGVTDLVIVSFAMYFLDQDLITYATHLVVVLVGATYSKNLRLLHFKSDWEKTGWNIH